MCARVVETGKKNLYFGAKTRQENQWGDKKKIRKRLEAQLYQIFVIKFTLFITLACTSTKRL